MAEERKDSFAETVDTAASAAHTVKSAIKAGKAISGAAKGAAAGGPYGAVAGAVWAGRKHIGKIIAVIITLLLLPVLFVLMLPGLIFGGLINAFSPADTEQPILIKVVFPEPLAPVSPIQVPSSIDNETSVKIGALFFTFTVRFLISSIRHPPFPKAAPSS